MEQLHAIMAPSPQPWTVSSILDHGHGDVLLEDGARACLRVMHFHFLEGPFDETFADALLARIKRPAMITASDETWRQHFAKAPGVTIERMPRWLYVWPKGATVRASLLVPPQGFTLHPIGREEFANIQSYEWCDEVFDSYAGVDDFLTRGFGTCAKHDGKIVALCMTFATSRHGVEIEVDTDPTFQGRGLGKAVSAQAIAECLRRGLPPLWDASNEPSARLAEALGFEMMREYEAFEVR
jgi:GNAT superfamily N-acetyltransferase